jgi:hypothetical protein
MFTIQALASIESCRAELKVKDAQISIFKEQGQIQNSSQVLISCKVNDISGLSVPRNRTHTRMLMRQLPFPQT